ncbi:MAG TPA: crossover junction endodeoxyribonuclease RuvC [Candidatus Paceibacterota bacterium]|nr:crossover junction endodeoxyribonuclease RuvC [Candidatus Paceibacterota bacterium]
MRILAIDPGYGRVGIAIVDKEKGQKEKVVFSECFETDSKLAFADRLVLVKNRVKKVVEEFTPTVAGTEILYMAKNRKTAIDVAHARGVIIAEIRSAGIPVKEYNPGQIKIALTGHGASDKKQVRKMVEIILGETFDKEAKDDEWDAVAIGLTVAAIERE